MKFLLNIFTLLLLASCAEESTSVVSSSVSSISGKYCTGLTELDLDLESPVVSLFGVNVTMSKALNGTDFTLTGVVDNDGVEITITIASNLNSDGLTGIATVSIGEPINMVRYSYLEKSECETDEVDELGVGAEKLVVSNPIDINGDGVGSGSGISDISLFRSSAGHDASDDFESCRSMKHYFEPYVKANSANDVYAPFDGTIISMNTEEGGGFEDDGITNQLITIRPDSNRAYLLYLYHVDVLPSLNLSIGDTVTAGDHLGYGRLVRVNSGSSPPASASNDFDVQVKVKTSSGVRSISLFHVLSDSAFADYSTFSSNRDDFIITKSQRDADSLACSGETFTSFGTLDRWFSDTTP